MNGILGTQIVLAAFFAALAILAVVDGVWGADPSGWRGFGPAWQPAPDDDAHDAGPASSQPFRESRAPA